MDNQNQLNTGWKKWDKFLSKFVGKKINCLDIGSFEGASTCWMLNNLCANPYSLVFSVDTWEGGPDYTGNTDFKKVEETFNTNVEETGKKNQHIKLKMSSSEALIKLRDKKYVFFDFIFIDASHEAKDVLSDAILSWEILVDDGIMIFDDYEWEKLNKDYFCPKVAVDSFNYIYKPQLEILHKGYQCIVRKKKMYEYEKPESGELYKLIDDVNYFKFYEFEITFDNLFSNEKLKYKLSMYNLPPDEKLKQMSYREFNLISDKIGDFFELLKNCDTIENYNFYHLFHVDKPFDVINKTLAKKFKKEIENSDLFKNVDYFNLFIKNNLIDSREFIKYIEKNCGSKICLFLRTDFDIVNAKKKIEKLFDCNYDMKVYTIFDNPRNQITKIKFEHYEDLKNIITDNHNIKYDLLFFKAMIKKNNVLKYILEKKNLFSMQLFGKIFVCLSLQKINGNAILSTPVFLNNVFYELVVILKKYYTKIKISSARYNRRYGSTIVIECQNFLGINSDELMEFEKIAIEMFDKKKNISNYEEGEKIDLMNILSLDEHQQKIITDFKKIIKEHLDLYLESASSYYELLYKIKKFIDKNNFEKNDKLYMLQNIIYKKQISEFIYSLNFISNCKKLI